MLITNGDIGTMEMVSSTAAYGMIYALTSSQPITIISSTGSVLTFVATLVKLANNNYVRLSGSLYVQQSMFTNLQIN